MESLVLILGIGVLLFMPPDFTRRPGTGRFNAPDQNRASFNRQ